MTAPAQTLTRSIKDATDFTKILATQLRVLSDNGDDGEVRDFLLRQADTAASERDRLLQATAGESDSNRLGVELASKIPLAPFLERTQEEKILDALLVAFSALNVKRAMLTGLRAAADKAGDTDIGKFAADAAASAAQATSEAWRFIPSRSKIALNVLTAGEIDPAVETKTASPAG